MGLKVNLPKVVSGAAHFDLTTAFSEVVQYSPAYGHVRDFR